MAAVESVEIYCPYCGEINSIAVEWGASGPMIEDCWVCCHPIELDVRWDEWGDPQVSAERSSG